MDFLQDPPRLGNQYLEDRVLQSYLARVIPDYVRSHIVPSLERMGELAGGPLLELCHEARQEEPQLVQWDPWGRRIDEIKLPEAWKEFARVAVKHGLVATAYEQRHGRYSRVHQFALVYLFDRSSHTYTCPLAMTDGAAKTLSLSALEDTQERILPRLLSRDPSRAWTAGQWMTEKTGGSDVGLSETTARRANDGWRLHGTKWFTSAVTSEVALTLARPDGNPPGGKGLALFLVQKILNDGSPNRILVRRLKEKLGTRMLPTAELDLDGALAEPIGELKNGVKNITPLLNITRTWNSICATASLRRGIALSRDYARRRFAFGYTLAKQPLHLETLAEMETEFEAAFHLAFRIPELLGADEIGALEEDKRKVLRMLQPVAKLLTGRQAVAGASECLETFGGAGYLEETGLPVLLRDAQVFSIWEGTTNVLALDMIRAIVKEQALIPFLSEIRSLVSQASHSALGNAAWVAMDWAKRAEEWFSAASSLGSASVERGARQLAFALGRAMQLALLVRHAQWSIENEDDGRTALAAKRLAAAGIRLDPPKKSHHEISHLAMDEPLSVAELS